MSVETAPLRRSSRQPRRLLRRVLAGIGISLSAALALSGWALSTAVGAAPRLMTTTSVACGAQVFLAPTVKSTPPDKGVMIPPPLLVASYCLYHNSQQSAGCQPFLDGTDPREDFAFGHNNPSRSLYPNGFYMVGNLFKTDNIETTVVSIRLFNIAVFLSLLGALWLLLPTRLRVTLAWTWPIALLPLGMFLIPSTNPSSWAIIAVGTGWLALLGYLETNGWRSAGLAAIYLVALVLSVSSRVDSILFLGCGLNTGSLASAPHPSTAVAQDVGRNFSSRLCDCPTHHHARKLGKGNRWSQHERRNTIYAALGAIC